MSMNVEKNVMGHCDASGEENLPSSLIVNSSFSTEYVQYFGVSSSTPCNDWNRTIYFDYEHNVKHKRNWNSSFSEK